MKSLKLVTPSRMSWQATIAGGEPLMAMWARAKQRLLPANGGFVDVSDPKIPSS